MSVEIGGKAPAFTLPDQDGNKVSLTGLKGKWVVLYFYPRDNTPGCTIEGVEFTDLLNDFKKAKAVVLGCSPDSKESHCKFIKKKKLKVTLLSDPEHKVMGKYGAWGLKKLYGREFEGVIRSTVLISPAGKIARYWPKVRALNHAGEVLKALKELKR